MNNKKKSQKKKSHKKNSKKKVKMQRIVIYDKGAKREKTTLSGKDLLSFLSSQVDKCEKRKRHGNKVSTKKSKTTIKLLPIRKGAKKEKKEPLELKGLDKKVSDFDSSDCKHSNSGTTSNLYPEDPLSKSILDLEKAYKMKANSKTVDEKLADKRYVRLRALEVAEILLKKIQSKTGDGEIRREDLDEALAMVHPQSVIRGFSPEEKPPEEQLNSIHHQHPEIGIPASFIQHYAKKIIKDDLDTESCNMLSIECAENLSKILKNAADFMRRQHRSNMTKSDFRHALSFSKNAKFL